MMNGQYKARDDIESPLIQIPPVGTHPNVAVVFVGALLWSSPDAAEVLELVDDDDISDPALGAVLAAIRALVKAGRPASPQLVLDELRRTGHLRGNVPDRLRQATTSGANQLAARDYAAATIADSLRQRIGSMGHALIEAAPTASECDLMQVLADGATSLTDCYRRLTKLRGTTL
jgi:replicative DNA helicase